MARIKSLLVPVAYGVWHRLDAEVKIKFKRAGHILGSAYIEVDLAKALPYQPNETTLVLGDEPVDSERHQGLVKRIVFSGDLGAPYSPILPKPSASWRKGGIRWRLSS